MKSNKTSDSKKTDGYKKTSEPKTPKPKTPEPKTPAPKTPEPKTLEQIEQEKLEQAEEIAKENNEQETKIETELPNFDKTKKSDKDKAKTKRGRKKGVKNKKSPITIDLPIGIAIKELTKMMSRHNKKWLADDDECDDIEEGFNKWLAYRLPQIEKYSPEVYLILPVLCYVLRRF
jgi:hypothetical protein